MRSWIQRSHCTVNVSAFLAALALLGSSALYATGLPLGLEPFRACLALYNAAFAAAILCMDGPPAWRQTGCGAVRRRLYHAVPAFLSQRGRACFYLYVGSVNLGAFPPEDSFWRPSALPQKGEVKRVVGFGSPIGDSPWENRLPKGHQLAAEDCLVMLVALLSVPSSFHPRLIHFSIGFSLVAVAATLSVGRESCPGVFSYPVVHQGLLLGP